MEVSKKVKIKMFCTYLPCKGHYKPTGEVVSMGGYSDDTAYIEYWPMKDHNDSEWSHIDNFQLALTPLSEITDEHAIEVATMASKAKFEQDLYNGRIIISDIIKNRPIKTLHPNTLLAIFDYLRSESYMLPYMGIDLFEAGIAIDKTKMK